MHDETLSGLEVRADGTLRCQLRNLPPGGVFLDTARGDAENTRSLLFTAPAYVLEARRLEEVPGLFHRLDEAVAEGFWAAGFISYEAGYAFEPELFVGEGPQADDPIVWIGIYSAPEELVPTGIQERLPGRAGQKIVARDVAFGFSREKYRQRIDAIRQLIRDGDVYQINFTDHLDFRFDGDPLELYLALRARQHVAYGALLNTGSQHVLSLSPELFFRREGQRLWTRPMKGTARRGRTVQEDEQIKAWLAADEKSRAENLMIVDLLRNDLSVVSEPGSVRVPALFSTEHYETLIQMTSTIEGRLREGAGYEEIFRALFPCGSVTGAPKLRAMQHIRALEREARGVYCGAIGYIAPGDEAVFNVAIRTITLRDGQGRMGIGSGIVWDSDADEEYEECILKGNFLTGAASEEPFDLIETMRFENGKVALFELHRERLADSTAFFDRPFDEAQFRRGVDEAIGQARDDSGVVRVLLHPDGTMSLSTRPLPEEGALRRVAWAGDRVDSGDRFLFHKTTRRALYEHAYEETRAEGFDEVLFLNERGELTEGSRTNVFIEKEGRLLTPPVHSGLLGGVYRRHVLEETPRASQMVLYPEDVASAEAVYLCNAVRGWCRVDEVAAFEPRS